MRSQPDKHAAVTLCPALVQGKAILPTACMPASYCAGHYLRENACIRLSPIDIILCPGAASGQKNELVRQAAVLDAPRMERRWWHTSAYS